MKSSYVELKMLEVRLHVCDINGEGGKGEREGGKGGKGERGRKRGREGREREREGEGGRGREGRTEKEGRKKLVTL